MQRNPTSQPADLNTTDGVPTPTIPFKKFSIIFFNLEFNHSAAYAFGASTVSTPPSQPAGRQGSAQAR